MNYKVFIFAFLFLIPINADAVFDTYFAKRAYDKGDNELAKQKYQKVMLHDATQHAQAAYNLGKISYRQQQFEQAEAYFQQALQSDDVPEQLKKQSLFDGGNSQIKQQKWHEAYKSFEDFLSLEPDNEYAQKTFEYIKKMLEEQQKQQQEEQHNNKDRQQDQQKKSDNAQDQKNNENSENNEDSEKSNNQDQQDKEQSNKEKQQSEQQSNDRQNQQQQSEKKSESSQNNSENNDQSEKQEKNDDDQVNSEQQQDGSSDKQEKQQQPEAEPAAQGNNGKQQDKTEKLLALLDKSDAESSKKLLKAQLETKMQKRYGEKNW